jgi:hypothetical protein
VHFLFIIWTTQKTLFALLSFEKTGIAEYIDDLPIPKDIKVKHNVVCEGCTRPVVTTSNVNDSPHYCSTCNYLVGKYGPMSKWTETILLEVVDRYTEKAGFIKPCP